MPLRALNLASKALFSRAGPPGPYPDIAVAFFSWAPHLEHDVDGYLYSDVYYPESLAHRSAVVALPSPGTINTGREYKSGSFVHR